MSLEAKFDTLESFHLWLVELTECAYPTVEICFIFTDLTIWEKVSRALLQDFMKNICSVKFPISKEPHASYCDIGVFYASIFCFIHVYLNVGNLTTSTTQTLLFLSSHQPSELHTFADV